MMLTLNILSSTFRASSRSKSIKKMRSASWSVAISKAHNMIVSHHRLRDLSLHHFISRSISSKKLRPKYFCRREMPLNPEHMFWGIEI